MKSHSKFISITYRILRFTLKPLIQGLWIKSVAGVSNIPIKGGAIVAMNHQSFFDFLSFAVVCPRNTHFLSAEKFFRHILWRPLMIFSGQIKVERQQHDKSEVHQSVQTHLKRGHLVGIFPEGTRSPHKDEMLKAFTGIARYALEHRVPIIPVGIQGTHDILPKTGGKISFSKSININIGEPIHFPEHWDNHTDKEVRTYVTEKVIKQIEKLSGKKYPHYELNHEE